MAELEIPPALVYHGEATGRRVVYVDDVAKIVADELERLAQDIVWTVPQMHAIHDRIVELRGAAQQEGGQHG